MLDTVLTGIGVISQGRPNTSPRIQNFSDWDGQRADHVRAELHVQHQRAAQHEYCARDQLRRVRLPSETAPSGLSSSRSTLRMALQKRPCAAGWRTAGSTSRSRRVPAARAAVEREGSGGAGGAGGAGGRTGAGGFPGGPGGPGGPGAATPFDNAIFPNHCQGDLTNQEKVLLYMLFDLGACIGVIPLPMCTPATCKSLGATCGSTPGRLRQIARLRPVRRPVAPGSGHF